EMLPYPRILEGKVRIDEIDDLIVEPADQLILLHVVDWKGHLNFTLEWDVIGADLKAVEDEEILNLLVVSDGQFQPRGRHEVMSRSKMANATVAVVHLVWLV